MPGDDGTVIFQKASPGGSGPGRNRRTAFVFAVLLALGVLFLGSVWWASRFYETTDDAFLAGAVSNVAPQVPGRVVQVLAQDNQSVRAKEVLVRLDRAPYLAKSAQSRAELAEAGRRLQEAVSQHQAALATAEQARADASSAEAQADNAATDLGRYDQLARTGAVSQQARDNAQTLARTTASALTASRKRIAAAEAQAALAAAQIETARAAVDRYRAALDKDLLDLAYTEIRAGLDGKVTRKAVEPGDYLQPGQTVMSLVGASVWVVANFKETQIKNMRPGNPVAIVVDAYPDHVFKGRVDSIQAGTGAAFSLLPPQNASGNFVKVVQRVPVKITFELGPGEDAMHLAPGMSVLPRVDVRGAR